MTREFVNRRSYIGFIFALCLLFSATPLYADGTHQQGIKFDGTIGNAGKLDLPGPDYEIKPEYGKQAGSNLFHSFEQFNIHKGESATFSGSDSVKNIISRVTGGSASWIDGKLASPIPNADLYFLNPAGVMFGPNALLDLSGSFHVSTANYLRMGDNERFYAKPMANEVLSVAAPTAFGFLSDKPAKISADSTKLQVPEEKTISLIGGDIGLKAANIIAPGGRINLAAAASAGEVIPDASGLEVTSQQKGSISLSDKATLDASGTGGGSILIRSGQFTAEDSTVSADTLGNKDGQQIDIESGTIAVSGGSVISTVTTGTGKGGDIVLNAEKSVTISSSGVFDTDTGTRIVARSGVYQKITGDDLGSGGNIIIKAPEILFQDGAYLSVSTYGGGSGGDAALEASEISFTNGAIIASNTTGKGKGGSVTLNAGKTVSFDGEDSNVASSRIQAVSYYTSEGAGKAGTLSIEADNISFTNGAYIGAKTYGPGSGGDVFLKAANTVSFDGENSKAEVSRIMVGTGESGGTSVYNGSGKGGTVSIEADNISFTNGVYIGSNTYGSGLGGEVALKARNSVSFDGENSNGSTRIMAESQSVSAGAGDAGKISIEADNISFSRGAYVNCNTYGKADAGDITLIANDSLNISGANSKGVVVSAIRAQSTSADSGGKAGMIDISVGDSLTLTGGGVVTTKAISSGGGIITVTAGNTIYLLDGQITSSVRQGEGNGGDVTTILKFVILNNSSITANAYGGDGGAIFIRTDNYLKSSASKVTATSKRGNDGTVEIKAPDLNMSGMLTTLPANFPDAAKWAATPCAARAGDIVSRFFISGQDAVAFTFNDWQPSPLLWFGDSALTVGFFHPSAFLEKLSLSDMEDCTKCRKCQE